MKIIKWRGGQPEIREVKYINIKNKNSRVFKPSYNVMGYDNKVIGLTIIPELFEYNEDLYNEIIDIQNKIHELELQERESLDKLKPINDENITDILKGVEIK